jgi:hypothetical protein
MVAARNLFTPWRWVDVRPVVKESDQRKIGIVAAGFQAKLY